MTNIKTQLLGAAAAASLLAAGTAGAFVSLPLSTFKNGTPVTDGIFTYTYITSNADTEPDPSGGFPSIAPTNIPDAIGAVVNITTVEVGGEIVSTFQVANLAGLTGVAGTDIFTLSYTVEMYASDPTEDEGLRFQTLGHGADVDSADDNIGTTKYVTGQDTVVVPNADFTAELTTTPTSGADTATCGVCRKFAVTDVIDMTFAPGDRGIVFSISNTYRAAPVPATLALFGAGLLMMGGVMRRNRKG
jgi:hypothetical protein